MSTKDITRNAPSWMQYVAADAIRAAEQKLRDHMLSIDEDITDTDLWIHRRRQLYALLTERVKHDPGPDPKENDR